MKFTAIFLMVYLMVLTSLSGMAQQVNMPVKKNCCMEMKGKTACGKLKSSNHKNDCANGSCMMMLSCSICGFLIVEPLTLSPKISGYPKQPIALHYTGYLSVYQSADWKPPQIQFVV